MKSSLPNTHLMASSLLPLFFSISLLSAASAEIKNAITYHGGPLLTGNVSLAVIWYGKFERQEKMVIKTFIESLGAKSLSYEPDVGCWWEKVESFSEVAKVDGGGKVTVRLAREINDDQSVGKVLSKENLPALIDKATAGLANSIAVVFAAKNVAVDGTCEDTCYLHGVQGKQLYIVVGNPEDNCPGVCALPFHNPSTWVAPLAALTLEPPNENIGVDSMVIQFASALAETVTNPFHTGFFASETQMEVAGGCKDVFGPKAFPGYPGNVRVDSMNGGAFNAHGNNNFKFLVPSIVDPKTGSSCWTTLQS